MCTGYFPYISINLDGDYLSMKKNQQIKFELTNLSIFFRVKKID
jgi:hypothetical protein